METNETFEMLGELVEYTANSAGTHERITFAGMVIVDQTGDLGPWNGGGWDDLLRLSGAAKESKRKELIRQYV